MDIFANSPRSSRSADADEVPTDANSQVESSGDPKLPRLDFGKPPFLTEGTDTQDSKKVLRDLARFHVTGVAENLEAIDSGVLPALLAPYRDQSRVRMGYPLYLCPAAGTEELECHSLTDRLDTWVQTISPINGRTSILRDNLPRMERYVRSALAKSTGPANAQEILANAATDLKAELALKGDHATVLQGDLRALLDLVPEAGQLLGFDDKGAVSLLKAAAWAALPPRRAVFLSEVERLSVRLEEIVTIEAGKASSANTAENLQRTLGGNSGSSINMKALGAVLGPHRGTERLAPERLQSIQKALTTLKEYAARAETQSLLTIVHDVDLPEESEGAVELIRAADPCAEATAHFEDAAAEMASVFRAVRRARLEAAGNYLPEHHDSWLEAFDWQAFSRDEIRLVHPVVAVTSLDNISGPGLVSLSRLLRSAQPVKVIVLGHPASNPDAIGGPAGVGADARLEMGYFGISHREALVHSSSVARPEHLLHGLCTSLGSTHPGLHFVASTMNIQGEAPALGGWLHNGAAIEGRAHPLFFYDPEPGKTWAQRFDFDGNSQSDLDWPRSSLSYQDSEGEKSLELAFTFADFVLLEPTYAEHFCVVPAGFTEEELLPLEAFLELEEEDLPGKIPYLWAVDGKHQLSRLAVSRPLVFACRDRANYWRTLQELAGVRNEYVTTAVELAHKEGKAEADDKIAALKKAHVEELEAVRQVAASESIGRLAAALISTDFTASLTGPASVTTSPSLLGAVGATPSETLAEVPRSESSTAEAQAEPAQAEEDDDSFDEPWIDTGLCTTCNDCLVVNPQMFAYDDNKQALIKDAGAGTFKDLVVAAEKCPANCIHPGTPKNADEPNLSELIARAEPFN